MRTTSRAALAAALVALAGTALAVMLVDGRLVTLGSTCVGVDCVADEAFDGDTLRLKENNLRVRFDDTSDPATAPARDWRFTANAATNGGQNRFSIDDVDGDPFRGIAGADVTADAHETTALALGDLDGDARLDLVVGNTDQANRVYLNNATAEPFAEVVGAVLTADAHTTTAVALADLNFDMRLDAVVGNFGQPNRVYLNNATADPFSGVTGSDLTADVHATQALALGNLGGDPRPDVVVGNAGEPNRVYLNNGTPDPFAGVVGTDVTADADRTTAVAIGDLDGNGTVDVVAGNAGQPDRVYLNAGTPDPFAGVGGTDLVADAGMTMAVAIGDLDADGSLDVVVGGTDRPVRVHLNNGTAAPFAGVTPIDLAGDAGPTTALALLDLDQDGLLDLVVGKVDGPSRVHLNTGGADPFAGGPVFDLTTDVNPTAALAVLGTTTFGPTTPFTHVVIGRLGLPNRLYPLGDRDGGSKPFAIEAGAASFALHVHRGGRIGVMTPTPDSDTAAHVRGNLRVEGDLEIGADARGGTVPASAFAGRRRKRATVTFAEPYTTDYVILLTAMSRRPGAKLAPTVTARDAGGFTLMGGGRTKDLVAVHWATRRVGEY